MFCKTYKTILLYTYIALNVSEFHCIVINKFKLKYWFA